MIWAIEDIFTASNFEIAVMPRREWIKSALAAHLSVFRKRELVDEIAAGCKIRDPRNS